MDDMQSNGAPMDQGMPQEQGQGGYCIEIYVGADGRPQSVNVETMDEDMGEDQHGGPDGMPDMAQSEEKGVPVASLEDAMSMVKQIVQNQGQMPPDQGTAEDQMMQGYGKGGVGAKRGGLPVRKVFSEGM